MESKPVSSHDIVTLLRNADEEQIRQRLDELEAETEGLRTLLRAIRARERARQTTKRSTEGRHDA